VLANPAKGIQAEFGYSRMVGYGYNGCLRDKESGAGEKAGLFMSLSGIPVIVGPSAKRIDVTMQSIQ